MLNMYNAVNLEDSTVDYRDFGMKRLDEVAVTQYRDYIIYQI